MLEQKAMVWGDTESQIKLAQYFNLYPTIQLFIDVPFKYGVEQGQVFKSYSDSYDITNCATNIRYKTVLYNNCGQLTCKLIHPDCQKFIEGSRIRLYLDGICRFCGFLFTKKVRGENDMDIVCFDFLRYFKSPLTYNKSQLKSPDGTMGLPASDLFKKICMDLAIPCQVETASTIPVTAQNYDRKTGFNILEFAINHTLINSDVANRQYYTYFHETNLPEDQNAQNFQDTELYKHSGRVEWHLRNNLTVDVPLTDELLINYNYESTIDKQTYNEVVVWKDQKTYLSKTGKTLKKGKKTGTRQTNTVPAVNNEKKGLWGYLPYYHQAPDSYTEAQMQKVADELLDILCRPSQSLSLSCYGIPGLRAGHLLGVAIQDIAGSTVGVKRKDEQGNEILVPIYRTVKECEMLVEYPLKMNLVISAGAYGEYDV